MQHLATPPSPQPELGTVASILARRAENPSAFLALNDETRHFTVDGVDGVVAYRLAGRRTIVQLGGVFADPADQALLDLYYLRSYSVWLDLQVLLARVISRVSPQSPAAVRGFRAEPRKGLIQMKRVL